MKGNIQRRNLQLTRNHRQLNRNHLQLKRNQLDHLMWICVRCR